MRISVGRHVASLWHKLGDKKGNFIPNLVKPFLEISLIKHKGQSTLVQLGACLIGSCFSSQNFVKFLSLSLWTSWSVSREPAATSRESVCIFPPYLWCFLFFSQVETEVYDKIDDLVTSGRGDEEYGELFQDMSVATPTTSNVITPPSLQTPPNVCIK